MVSSIAASHPLYSGVTIPIRLTIAASVLFLSTRNEVPLYCPYLQCKEFTGSLEHLYFSLVNSGTPNLLHNLQLSITLFKGKVLKHLSLSFD